MKQRRERPSSSGEIGFAGRFVQLAILASKNPQGGQWWAKDPYLEGMGRFVTDVTSRKSFGVSNLKAELSSREWFNKEVPSANLEILEHQQGVTQAYSEMLDYLERGKVSERLGEMLQIPSQKGTVPEAMEYPGAKYGHEIPAGYWWNPDRRILELREFESKKRRSRAMDERRPR